jgi:hypothetical protein
MLELKFLNAAEFKEYPARVKEAVLNGIREGMLEATNELANAEANAAGSMTGQLAQKLRESAYVEEGPTLITGRLGKNMFFSARIALWKDHGTTNKAFDIRDKYGSAVAKDKKRAKGLKVRGSATAIGPNAVRQALMFPGAGHPFYRRKAFQVAGSNFLENTLDAQRDQIISTISNRIQEAIKATA